MNRLPRWSVGLIAFTIALVLWAVLFVRANPTNSQTKSGVLVVRNLASNLAIVDETGRRLTTFPIIKAQIYAAQSAFDQLPTEGLTFYVDATGLGAGVHELPVRLEWLPEWGYYRSEINEDQHVVTMRFEEVISKSFVPQIETIGMSSDTYYDRSVQLADSTAEVSVAGPQTLINQVEGVRLRFAYNASQMTSNESIIVVPINSQGEQVFGVDTTPSQVEVVVRVAPKFGVRSVVVKPNLIGIVAPGYEITSVIVDPAVVSIQGDVQLISDTTVIDTGAVPVAGESETITRTAQLLLNNVFLVDKSNTTVQVRVEISPIERNARMRLILPIEVRDVPEGFVLQADPGVYVVDVVVEPEALRRNTVGLIQAYVSVGEWDPAQPARQVQVVLPANVRRESELRFVNVLQIAPPIVVPEETAVPTTEPAATDGDGTAVVDAPIPTPNINDN